MNAIRYVGEHPRTFDVRWHSHDGWELVYCTGGEGAFRLEDGAVIRYREKEAVAIPPGVGHMNSSDGGFTNIHLTMDAPTFPYRRAFVVADDAEGHMGSAFAQARFYYLSDLKRRELILGALGELITSYMMVFQDDKELSESVKELRRGITSGFADPSFDLEREIRRMPFNYDYLRKLFQKEIGLTPLKYMISLRMKKAESMLTAAGVRGYSMTEVAESSGFGDALYFSRVFKKYYGCSPSEFVRRHAGREETEAPFYE